MSLIDRLSGRKFALFAAAGALVALCVARGSTASFALWHDDSLFFSSAKSLAEGEGYLLAQFPGTVYQTKYPIGYPLLLAGLWKIWPEFPANVAGAYALNAMFGALWLAGCLAWFERMKVGARPSLAMGLMCAAHPTVIFLTISALSDMPFLALSMWACVLADRALGRESGEGSRHAWIGACCIAAGAVLIRSIGLALPLGMALAAWRTGRRRGELVWCALPFAVFAGWTMWATLHRAPQEALVGAAPGYAQTYLYYTDYVGFWLASVPDLAALGDLLGTSAIFYLREPALMALQIKALEDSPVWAALACGLFFWFAFGAWKQARAQGPSVLHFVLIPYSVVVLLWNYAQTWRFMLLFLPLFLSAAYAQLLKIAEMVRRGLRAPDPLERGLSWGYVGAAAALAGAVAWGYLYSYPSTWRGLVAARAALLEQKSEAYDWIATQTDRADRVIAYEDAALYLHTGRRAMRPLALTTQDLYSPEQDGLRRQVERLEDVANEISAAYWLVSPDDYGVEAPLVQQILLDETGRVVSRYEEAFRSSGGSVIVYRRAVSWPR